MFQATEEYYPGMEELEFESYEREEMERDNFFNFYGEFDNYIQNVTFGMDLFALGSSGSEEEVARIATANPTAEIKNEIKQPIIEQPEIHSQPPAKRGRRKKGELSPSDKIILLEQNITKQELQAWKRKQTMIKNRISAKASRERKINYTQTLEAEVTTLQAENARLKRLEAEAEAIKAENAKLREENGDLKAKLAAYQYPSSKIDQFETVKAATVFRKEPAYLLAVILLVSFNVLSFGTNTQMEIPVEDFEVHRVRSLLWKNEDLDYGLENRSALNKCPIRINQTESIRLDTELRKWIGGTQPYVNGTNFNASLGKRIKSKSLRKKRNKNGRASKKIALERENGNMFGPSYDLSFEGQEPLYKAMDRKWDTFYVVSFSDDHLLLPASAPENATIAPKMSLLFPTTGVKGNASQAVNMMQIDCAVTNTKVLRFDTKDIPSQFRHSIISNDKTVGKSTKHHSSAESFLWHSLLKNNPIL